MHLILGGVCVCELGRNRPLNRESMRGSWGDSLIRAGNRHIYLSQGDCELKWMGGPRVKGTPAAFGKTEGRYLYTCDSHNLVGSKTSYTDIWYRHAHTFYISTLQERTFHEFG